MLDRTIINMYGRYDQKNLVDDNFGNPWGVAIEPDKIATYLDVAYYPYAMNFAQILKLASVNTPVFVDIGSGYGTLALKAAKLLGIKAKIILK